jgi:hypothetical protein
MTKCGGCGREIDTESIEDGSKYLCSHCYHLEIAGSWYPRTLSSRAFLIIAAACLGVLGLAGIALCILYVVGTGDLGWFVWLSLLMLCVVGCPAAALTRKRNVALLVTCLYLPLGVWSYLWYLAPGVNGEYSNMTAYGGYFFFVAGVITLFFFVRDMRMLPRL